MLKRPWLQPSLSRRLLLAQFGLLALLWLGLIGALVWAEMQDESDLRNEAQFELLLASARHPEVLARVEPYEKTQEDLPDEPRLRNHFIVRDADGRVIAASTAAPLGVPATAGDGVRLVESDGMRWRARTRWAPDGRVSATVIAPADAPRVMIRVSSSGFLILPLLVCLPFLVLPAWLSVHLALRPWQRVSEEIAARGPDDLAAIPVAGRHRELLPLLNAVNALMAKLQQARERERSFIADAAHELRTPVAALRVNVEALQRRQGAQGRDAELFAAVVRASERAGHLVAQLLSLMRSQADPAGRLGEGVAVRLDALLQDRMAALAPLAAARGVEMSLEVPGEALQVFAAPQALASLIDNLLDNAIKYGPAGGPVSLKLGREGDRARIEVEDKGPGIPAALRERVFDRFYRGADAAQAGSGLGLAIARAVATRLGGTVSLGDRPGAPAGGSPGLRVTVLLPLCAGS